MPKSYEPQLRELRKQPSLADSIKENPVQWLINFKKYTKSRKWTEKQSQNVLPLIWPTTENEDDVEDWYNSLSKTTKTDFSENLM